MDNPDDYTKSVIVSQTFITTVYLVCAIDFIKSTIPTRHICN